jgi:hypothetical protein
MHKCIGSNKNMIKHKKERCGRSVNTLHLPYYKGHGLAVFKGLPVYPSQRGYGIGSFLSGLFRTAVPFLAKGAKQVVKAAVPVIKQSGKEIAKTAASEILKYGSDAISEKLKNKIGKQKIINKEAINFPNLYENQTGHGFKRVSAVAKHKRKKAHHKHTKKRVKQDIFS